VSWSTCTYTAAMARNYTWPSRMVPDLNIFCSFPQPYLGSQQQLIQPQLPEEAMRCSYSYPVGPARSIHQNAIHVNDFSASEFRPSHFGDSENPPFHSIHIPYRAVIPDHKCIIAPSMNGYGTPSQVRFSTFGSPVNCLFNYPSLTFPCRSGFGHPISASAFVTSSTANTAPHCPTSNDPVSSLQRNQAEDFTVEDSNLVTSLVKTLDPIVKVVKKKCNTKPKPCIHNKRKTLCALCCGGSICEHKLQKHWCRLCGGGARCSHGKQKSRCRECGGCGYCEHDTLRFRCRLCKSAKAAKSAANISI
jgi:hypothetical protein